ncbi:hypothetical protein [Enterococcus termitis]|uniref:hypothetical protein n=1 Tax=Enterococcus termitis TaxID=332950 RepID=UPI0009119923|nr:hypothetical protein [Enterococcus termitis]OJG97623.1 hypothetical protein RV18_GL000691 [Enterococcus termitis]
MNSERRNDLRATDVLTTLSNDLRYGIVHNLKIELSDQSHDIGRAEKIEDNLILFPTEKIVSFFLL